MLMIGSPCLHITCYLQQAHAANIPVGEWFGGEGAGEVVRVDVVKGVCH